MFGASGRTGKMVVEQALEKGYRVTAIVRNPEKLPIRHTDLEIVRGDVLQILSFENLIHKNATIISCLGVQNRNPTTLYSAGITNIIQTMEKAGARRILCFSAVAVIVPPKSPFVVRFFTKYILQRIFKYMYADLLAMEEIVCKSGLDWTVIRPPRLLDSKLTGTYRVSINEPLRNPSKISRADLADYMLNHASDEKTYKSIIEVSY